VGDALGRTEVVDNFPAVEFLRQLPSKLGIPLNPGGQVIHSSQMALGEPEAATDTVSAYPSQHPCDFLFSQHGRLGTGEGDQGEQEANLSVDNPGKQG